MVFYNFAQRMVERGHKVHVICHEYAALEEVPNQVITHRIKPKVEHRGGLPPSITHNLRYMVNAFLKGSELLRHYNFDVLHSNNFSPIIAGSALSTIFHKPLVCTIHDVFSTSSPHYWKDWAAQNNVSYLSSKIGPVFEKLTTKVPSDRIHTVSNATREDLIKFGVQESKIVVIPNGLDLRYYNSNLGSAKYENYIVFIGRLVFYKNLDLVIRAFSKVVEKVPNAKLIVIGDGPMMNPWKDLTSSLGLSNFIEFTGYLPEDEKKVLLERCKALILPSLFEGFGLVILEAFAMYKPVLVPNILPYTEIVEDGVDGFLLPPHNQEKWEMTITSILQEPNLSIQMGKKARDKVVRKYDIDKVVELIESLYTEIIAKGSIKPLEPQRF